MDWHLDSGGAAHKANDGLLRADGAGSGGEDGFTYDPQNPVPTHGGAVYWGLENRGPLGQRSIIQRADVLCYRSAALATPLTVIGDVELSLYLASDQEDTDVVVRLCVETPDGAVTCLSLGSLRCRFRNNWSAPEPLERNTPTALRVQLGQTAYTFSAGSRIVLTVTSSDFPRILPHPNRIAPLFEGDPIVARNSILHGPEFPSRLHLPVIEGI